MSDQASLEMIGWLSSEWSGFFQLPTDDLPVGEWWEHGPFLQWLVSTLNPRTAAGTGEIWNGVQHFIDRHERLCRPPSLQDPQARFDLLVLSAQEVEPEQVESLLEQLANVAVVVLHGINPGYCGADLWPLCARQAGAQTFEMQSGAGLGLALIGNETDFPSALAGLLHLTPPQKQAFTNRCARLADAWELARQHRLQAVRIASLSRRVQLLGTVAPPDVRRPSEAVSNNAPFQPASYASRFTNRAKRYVARLREPKPAQETLLVKELAARPDLFDAEVYLQENPDVLAAGVDPYIHFVQYGAVEGRYSGPFDGPWYLDAYPEVARAKQHPLLHYLSEDKKRRRPIRLSGPDTIALPFWHSAATEFVSDGSLTDATLYRVGTGVVARTVDSAKLQTLLSAIEQGLDLLAQTVPLMRLVVDDGVPVDLRGLVSGDIRCLPLAGVSGFSGGHNRAMEAAFESGANFYVGVHAQAQISARTLPAMVMAIRGSGEDCLVLDRLPCVGDQGENTDVACFAISERFYQKIGGLDVSLSAREALIDYVLRAMRLGGKILIASGVGTQMPSVQKNAQLSGIQRAGSAINLGRKWRCKELVDQSAARLQASGAAVPMDESHQTGQMPPVRLPELACFDQPELLW
ncbi:hypothetical protein FPY71_11490 [Aureimonas fodinaquatilis]|uniref:Uncharacterized protein n=1 Tax=Aureimonas fodinaquatilis TaxID=2565783 RepID=A0A5B0DZ81_9HYPH|nr:hypothetical protein [Aureimonas fodinaquatilis]KAA0971061.1 hypothetical protein FPY71_11490 [Aureimonas fodinaquatilis]